MGVSAKSIVKNEAELRERLAHTIDRYQQTALVERFISGREVTVGLVGNISGVAARRLPTNYYNNTHPEYSDEAGLAALKAGGMTFLPPLEVDLTPYKDTEAVYSNLLKTDLADAVPLLCPAPLEVNQVRELNWLTAAVFRVIGCADFSRVDFRLDEHDNFKPYILEINPLPGLAPGLSDLVLEAAAHGISHTELINLILEAAIIRHGLTAPRTFLVPRHERPPAAELAHVAPARPADRELVGKIAEHTGAFNPKKCTPRWSCSTATSRTPPAAATTSWPTTTLPTAACWAMCAGG